MSLNLQRLPEIPGNFFLLISIGAFRQKRGHRRLFHIPAPRPDLLTLLQTLQNVTQVAYDQHNWLPID